MISIWVAVVIESYQDANFKNTTTGATLTPTNIYLDSLSAI
jgi:hypothetical protein